MIHRHLKEQQYKEIMGVHWDDKHCDYKKWICACLQGSDTIHFLNSVIDRRI